MCPISTAQEAYDAIAENAHVEGVKLIEIK